MPYKLCDKLEARDSCQDADVRTEQSLSSLRHSAFVASSCRATDPIGELKR